MKTTTLLVFCRWKIINKSFLVERNIQGNVKYNHFLMYLDNQRFWINSYLTFIFKIKNKFFETEDYLFNNLL